MPNWSLSSYACPECEGRLEGCCGPDHMEACRCPECEWSRVFDPAADEFAVSTLKEVEAENTVGERGTEENKNE